MAPLTVVTGAEGHLGNNLVRALLARGRAVRALTFGDARSLEGLDVQRWQVDVRDAAAVHRALQGAEAVFHLAAVISLEGDRGLLDAVNVGGTRIVARAALAAGVRRMVHCSSFRVYRSHPEDALTEASPRVRSDTAYAYDRSKQAAERELARAVAQGLDAVTVNPTGILGPYDFGPSRLGAALRRMMQGRLPVVLEGGCDWVDVRDVAQGLLAAEERGRRGTNYLLGGHHATVRELAVMASEFSGAAPPWFAVPHGLVRALAPAVHAGARALRRAPPFTSESLASLREHPRVSSARAERELGYAPRALRETMAALHRWFLAQGSLDAAAPRGGATAATAR